MRGNLAPAPKSRLVNRIRERPNCESCSGCAPRRQFLTQLLGGDLPTESFALARPRRCDTVPNFGQSHHDDVFRVSGET